MRWRAPLGQLARLDSWKNLAGTISTYPKPRPGDSFDPSIGEG